ncbi:MAG: hypothetical protein Q9166_007158 [cf. Caloplaca sp. 2 TL-2023]
MRVILIAGLLLATLTFSSVIPSKFTRIRTDNAVLRPRVQADSISVDGEPVKRQSASQCQAVRVKQGICNRAPGPQGGVILDPSYQPVTECFRNLICCGVGCNGLDIVGPATSGPKRDVMSEKIETTVMEKPNMKPLVKRQDPLAPQVGQQVTIHQNGQLVDQNYADLSAYKLPSASPPPPPVPSSAVLDTVFIIGYFQNKKPGLPQGAEVPQFATAVFAGISGIDERTACHNQPAYRDTESTTGQRPKLPQKINFDATGRKHCEFDRAGDPDDAGRLTCDGILATCSKVSGDLEPIGCKDGGETWRTQAICIF